MKAKQLLVFTELLSLNQKKCTMIMLLAKDANYMDKVCLLLTILG